MFDKGTIANLVKQAQKMQERLQAMQEEMAALEVEGQAGAGIVRLLMNGRYEVRRVSIDPAAMEDREMLEDLLVAAFNDAVRRVEERVKERVAETTVGMILPPGFNFPL
ncbi:MAG: YbaB/EbfC family nucleoid-associated protein [Hydrogenophilus sp.]|nr:YbaB/EbfC family nucleoid-associated protein [Hydrogenophilus sp.]